MTSLRLQTALMLLSAILFVVAPSGKPLAYALVLLLAVTFSRTVIVVIKTGDPWHIAHDVLLFVVILAVVVIVFVLFAPSLMAG